MKKQVHNRYILITCFEKNSNLFYIEKMDGNKLVTKIININFNIFCTIISVITFIIERRKLTLYYINLYLRITT